MGVYPKPVLDAPSNVGQPLEAALRHELEAAHNLDLSNVMVHVGHEPIHVGAPSFVSGDDIFVTPGNEHLIPHEAVHVVQQRQEIDLTPELAANLVDVGSDGNTPEANQ